MVCWAYEDLMQEERGCYVAEDADLDQIESSILTDSESPPKVVVRLLVHGAYIRFSNLDQVPSGQLLAMVPRPGERFCTFIEACLAPLQHSGSSPQQECDR